MGQLGEMFGFGIQAARIIEFQRGTGTLAELLSVSMDGVDRTIMRRKSLKERLGLKSIGCCGSQFPTTVSVRDEEEEEEAAPIDLSEIEIIDDNNNRGSSRGMNLAAALAAERELRAALESESPPNEVAISTSSRSSGTVPGTPARVSLMRLLEEADGGVKRRKEDDEEEEGGGLGGCDSVCCVCMGRKKGAAFIPCGHTFCRVCSREVWLNRGSCPLCNRFILEILDIY